MPAIGIHLSLFIMSIRVMNCMRYIWLKVNQSSSDWSINRGRAIYQGMESSRSIKLKYQYNISNRLWLLTLIYGGSREDVLRSSIAHVTTENRKLKLIAGLHLIYTQVLWGRAEPTIWNEIRHSLSNITCKGFILSKVYTYLYSNVCSKIFNKSP